MITHFSGRGFLMRLALCANAYQKQQKIIQNGARACKTEPGSRRGTMLDQSGLFYLLSTSIGLDFGSFWRPKWCQKHPKIGPGPVLGRCWAEVGSSTSCHPLFRHVRAGFWHHFGTPNRSQIDPKRYHVVDQILESISDRFWMVFGPLFGTFC